MSQGARLTNARTIYRFIKAHERQFPVEVQCKVLNVAPSGYYAWLNKPISDRKLEDARLLRLIRASYDYIEFYIALGVTAISGASAQNNTKRPTPGERQGSSQNPGNSRPYLMSPFSQTSRTKSKSLAVDSNDVVRRLGES